MEFTKEITLMDTTAPSVEAKKKEIIIEYGSEEFDLNAWIEENVSYSDNCSKEVKIALPEINTTQEDTVMREVILEVGFVLIILIVAEIMRDMA